MKAVLKSSLLLFIAIFGGFIGSQLSSASRVAAQHNLAPLSYVCTDAKGNLTTDCHDLRLNSPHIYGNEIWPWPGTNKKWTVGVWPDGAIAYYFGDGVTNAERSSLHKDGGLYPSYVHVNIAGPKRLCVSQAGIINGVGGSYC